MSDPRSPPGGGGSGGLPPRLRALVDDVVGASGLKGAPARRVRLDLEEHLRDGLERGRSVEELMRRFGDPSQAALLLSRHPAPVRGDRDPADGLARSLVADARHAARSLVRSPTVSVAVAVVLALGLGANTVVFTVLNELLLRPIPVEDPGSLVDVWAEIPGDNSFAGFSYPDFEVYHSENGVLENLAAFIGRRLPSGEAATAQEVTGQFVTPGYFEMLELRPALGSLSFAEHATFGSEAVAVLSHAYWSETYGSDPSIVGRSIRLKDRPVTVVGVGPLGFSGHFIGFPVDIWLPLAAADRLIDGFDPDDRASKELEMIGRLRPGVSVPTAESALDAMAEELERRHPDVNRGHRVGVTHTTGIDHGLQGAVRTFVTVLAAVAGLVLVIACLNVGGVLLARAMARDRELAVRMALGAGRVRLLRLLVTESSMLVGVGAVLGVGVAIRLNHALTELLRALSAGIALELAVDWRVLGLTGLAALGSSLLATVAPALHVLRKSPAETLRARTGDTPGGSRLRATLVIGQVAVSVVLMIATGLFVRALVAGARADPGFDADRVATFALDLSGEAGDRARAELRRDVVRAISRVPAVEGVAAASGPPVGVGRSPASLVVPGVIPPPEADHYVVDVRRVGPAYLRVLGIPLLSGRGIEEDDDTGVVAVVSAALERRFGGEGTLVGSTVEVDGRDVRVVGVAADTRYVVQDDTPDPLVYLSTGGDDASLPFVTFRAPDPSSVGERVHAAVAGVVPGYRPTRLRTGREVLAAALLPQRLGAVIVGAMGVAALFLSGVGLYGLVQFTVARDMHQLGVRLALGGGRRELLTVVLRKGVRLVLIGTALGVTAALVLAPGLSGFLSGVSPADPLTYGLVVACFGVVALVASWLPARRAMRIDAIAALRSD